MIPFALLTTTCAFIVCRFFLPEYHFLCFLRALNGTFCHINKHHFYIVIFKQHFLTRQRKVTVFDQGIFNPSDCIVNGCLSKLLLCNILAKIFQCHQKLVFHRKLLFSSSSPLLWLSFVCFLQYRYHSIKSRFLYTNNLLEIFITQLFCFHIKVHFITLFYTIISGIICQIQFSFRGSLLF